MRHEELSEPQTFICKKAGCGYAPCRVSSWHKYPACPARTKHEPEWEEYRKLWHSPEEVPAHENEEQDYRHILVCWKFTDPRMRDTESVMTVWNYMFSFIDKDTKSTNAIVLKWAYIDELEELEKDEEKTPTNGDKIRRMNNEEIADYMCVHHMCDYCPAESFACDSTSFNSNELCKKSWIDWLNKEVETKRK